MKLDFCEIHAPEALKADTVAKMRQQAEVTPCYQVEGEYDFLVKADVTSEKELEKLERSVRKINGVRSMPCKRSYSHTRSRALKVSSKFSLP